MGRDSRPPKRHKGETEQQEPQPHAGGRPTAYKPEFVQQVEKLCKLGATDEEIGAFFEVTARTVYRWQNEYPEFCQALKVGKEAFDERVERSLYHRAVGYTFESEKVFQFQGQIVRAKTVEHVPPDTTAGIFWLKNRRPNAWRDIRQHEVGGPGDFDRLSDDELRTLITQEAEEIGVAVPTSKTSH